MVVSYLELHVQSVLHCVTHLIGLEIAKSKTDPVLKTNI
jgi:hypothetical protein